MRVFYQLPEGSTEEKLQYLEQVFNGLATRLPQVITAKIPPTPISQFVETPASDGAVLRYVFPVAGTLLHAFVKIDDRKECQKIMFTAELAYGLDRQSKAFEVRTDELAMPLGLPIEAGTRLTVRCDQPVQGIWIGLLYQCREDKAEVFRQAIEQAEYIRERIHS